MGRKHRNGIIAGLESQVALLQAQVDEMAAVLDLVCRRVGVRRHKFSALMPVGEYHPFTPVYERGDGNGHHSGQHADGGEDGNDGTGNSHY